MKINFTKKEYLVLLQTLEITDWVLHAFQSHPREETAPFWNLHQRLLSHAKEMGYERFVDRLEDPIEYAFSNEYEDTESAMDLVREFEADSFWTELGDRLAERDLIRELGFEEFENLNPIERVERLIARANAWDDEFKKSGLDRFTLAEQSRQES